MAGTKMEREIREQPEALAAAGTLRERGFRSVSRPKPSSRRRCRGGFVPTTSWTSLTKSTRVWCPTEPTAPLYRRWYP